MACRNAQHLLSQAVGDLSAARTERMADYERDMDVDMRTWLWVVIYDIWMFVWH